METYSKSTILSNSTKSHYPKFQFFIAHVKNRYQNGHLVAIHLLKKLLTEVVFLANIELTPIIIAVETILFQDMFDLRKVVAYGNKLLLINGYVVSIFDHRNVYLFINNHS